MRKGYLWSSVSKIMLKEDHAQSGGFEFHNSSTGLSAGWRWSP